MTVIIIAALRFLTISPNESKLFGLLYLQSIQARDDLSSFLVASWNRSPACYSTASRSFNQTNLNGRMDMNALTFRLGLHFSDQLINHFIPSTEKRRIGKSGSSARIH